MYWWIWMLAGIGAFWCIFAAICTPLFIIGGFIALKKGCWDLHDETKAQTAEDILPASEAETLNIEEIDCNGKEAH